MSRTPPLMDHEVLISKLERCELKAGEFDHHRHVQAAFYLIKSHGLCEATMKFVGLIKNFARHHDADGLYNETITLFFLQMIGGRLDADPNQDWQQFRHNHPDLFNANQLLERHYSKALLSHTGAKRHFFLPDKKPVDGLHRVVD